MSANRAAAGDGPNGVATAKKPKSGRAVQVASSCGGCSPPPASPNAIRIVESPERRLVEGAYLAGVQAMADALQLFDGRDTDTHVLRDRSLVEAVGHSGQLELTV